VLRTLTLPTYRRPLVVKDLAEPGWPRCKIGRMDFLLVHGTTRSPAGWGRPADRLAARGHRSVAADLPFDTPIRTLTSSAEKARCRAPTVP
jgi:hypothetical protein